MLKAIHGCDSVRGEVGSIDRDVVIALLSDAVVTRRLLIPQHLRHVSPADELDVAAAEASYDDVALHGGRNSLALGPLAAWESGRAGSPLQKKECASVGELYLWIGATVGWEASASAAVLRSLLGSESSRWRVPHLYVLSSPHPPTPRLAQ